jgi:hypothetical protein
MERSLWLVVLWRLSLPNECKLHITFRSASPKQTREEISRIYKAVPLNSFLGIERPFNIRKWQCKKRPALSEKVAKHRFEWVLLRKDWGEKEWAMIIFSDESSVERGIGAQREWVWRTAEQKWSPQFVQTYTKGHNISIMVWGCYLD